VKPLTAEDLANEAVEDAIDAAVDYGYVQARRKFDMQDLPAEVEEKAENMLDLTVEKLYQVIHLLRKGVK
jgi:uncharacterized protein YajQ (UPF0234 family)